MSLVYHFDTVALASASGGACELEKLFIGQNFQGIEVFISIIWYFQVKAQS